MAKTARFILILMTAYLASIALPDLYRTAFGRNVPRVVVQYSETLDKFIISGRERNVYTDTDGNSYDRNQYEELFPVSAVHQLVKRGVFPDTVRGVGITPEMALTSHYEYYMRIPDSKPNYGIRSVTHGGTDLAGFVRTGRMMRVRRDGIEFYDCEKKCVDREMTAKFDAQLRELGYAPPDRQFSGISGGRDRDDGLFFTDRNYRIFQVKYYAYEPVVREVVLPAGVRPVRIEFIGQKHPEVMGYVIGDDDVLYLVDTDCGVRPIALDGFEYGNSSQLHVMEHLFFRMFIVSKPGYEKMHVFDRDYNYIDSYQAESGRYEDTPAGIAESFLLPASTITHTWQRGYVFSTEWQPFLRFIWLNLLLAAALAVVKRRRRQDMRDIYNILDVAAVAAFGLLALPGVFIFPSRE